jgi:hypothetical protein
VLKLLVLYDLQQKSGELIISIPSCPLILSRKYFKLSQRRNVLMVTLTTSIMFLLFTCMHFWLWEILRRRSTCPPTAYEVARDCRKFEKHSSSERQLWTVNNGNWTRKKWCSVLPTQTCSLFAHCHYLVAYSKACL